MRKSYLFGALAVAAVAIVACTGQAEQQKPQGLVIEKQGVFSSGGRVTEAIPGEYDPTQNWLDPERKGTTTHVDHANTFYQIPADGSGTPIVFLHGYGQTRTGWQSTPDGREGWSDLFLKKGYSVFLVDQPRRGAAGATEEIVTDPGDVANGRFKVGEQAWYTHFRIGRVAPERYEGSQFPEGSEALEQFFCQMTPNTGNYDEVLFGQALSAVLKDVQTMTGRKSIYVTHSQGGRVGWATDTDNMAAVIAVEPGFAPEVGSDTYKKFVAAKVPMLFLFGDYIENGRSSESHPSSLEDGRVATDVDKVNGPEDIQSTGFWKMVLQQCRDFAKQYNADGGDAMVIYLPDENIHGNSHFMFQEKNNAEIADLVGEWLKKHNL